MLLLEDKFSEQFFNILSSWSNPFLLIIFITIVILILIFFINRYLVKPLEEKHIQEKKEIELRNSRMMALFAELDPDPVIRIDAAGNVIFFNKAASNLIQIELGKMLPEYLLKISPAELNKKIKSDESYSFPFHYNGIHYNVLMKANASLGIAQLYLRDISQIKNLEIRLKQLSNYLQNQLDDERNRIAHELHDGIVQDLYLVQMGLRNLSEQSGAGFLSLIDPIKSQLENTTEELRRIIYDLKPKILDEMGLEPALQTLCNNIVNETGIKGNIEILGLKQRLDKKLEIYFYRVIQEAISNIVKHSGASEFSVILIKEKGNIRTIISDNGCGFNEDRIITDSKSGFGLLNIKERTEGLGGILKIDSSENEGLTLIAEIPVQNN